MTRERKLELTRKIGLFGLSDLRKLAPIGDLGYANGWYEPSGDGADIGQDIMYAMLGVAMARMETGVALDISEVREVMKKYHITIV